MNLSLTDSPSPRNRGNRWKSALQSERLMAILLALVVSIIVGRTLWLARESPLERQISELFERANAAICLTKLAYSPELITAPRPPSGSTRLDKSVRPSASVTGLPGSKRSNAGSGSKPASLAKETGSLSRLALDAWWTLVDSKSATAAEWRRYGIVLALFHNAGALEALSRVATAAPTLATETETGNRRASPLQKSHRRRETSRSFGHGKVNITPSDEQSTWKAIYGTAPLDRARVPALRHTLQSLRLGWFEHIALGQLYAKAGMNAEALREAKLARESTVWVWITYNIPTYGTLIGVLALVYLALRALIRRNGTPSTSPGDAIPLYPGQASERPLPISVPSSSGALFPISILLLAFVTYLTWHLALGYLIPKLFLPFTPVLDRWSGSALLRFDALLQYLIYVPTLLVPLWVLKANAPFDPVTGERTTLRNLLYRLGYHTESLSREVKTALGAYILMLPVMALAHWISTWLFSRFHTPVNPAEFEMLAANVPLDRILVLITAAVCAPIVEETLFRGVLYNALRARLGVPGGIALSAAVFAIVHPTLPGGFLPIWVIGVALAMVYEQRRSLLPGIILHAVYNGIIMLTGFAIFSN